MRNRKLTTWLIVGVLIVLILNLPSAVSLHIKFAVREALAPLQSALTGVIGASALAAVGLYVLPYRRTKIKQQLREQINQLREQLSEAMTRQFEGELGDGMQRIREAIAPYSRFVRIEREKLEKLRVELDRTASQIGDMQHKLNQMV